MIPLSVTVETFAARPKPRALGGIVQPANSMNYSEGWESLTGLWERASLIRSFLWQQAYADVEVLLNQYLARLRRFYGVDFCAGGLLTEGDRLASSAVPGASLDRLPERFGRRCLDLVAHARAPIRWNEVKAEFGFRSMVVAPVAPPSAEPTGFLMLGHSSRRIYSAAELFVLQILAGELSWVGRELNRNKNHRKQLAGLSDSVKNTFQSIVGNIGLIRQNLSDSLDSEKAKPLCAIESGIEKMNLKLDLVPAIATDEIWDLDLSVPTLSDRES